MRESRFKAEDIRQALEQTCGNITHAADLLEISKMHTIRLIERFSLGDYAKLLRESVGCSATGRPKKWLGRIQNRNIWLDSVT